MTNKNILAIVVEGQLVLDIDKNSNYIVISNKEPEEDQASLISGYKLIMKTLKKF